MEGSAVSVVIPYFNGSATIDRAIQSVFSQTIPVSEIIIVDDGSTEIEYQHLSKLSTQQTVRIFRRSNFGQSSARNFGSQIAKGQYLCFLDQDDFFTRTHVEVLLEGLISSDASIGFTFGDAFRVQSSGLVYAHSIHQASKMHPPKTLISMLSSNLFILPSATMYKTEVFVQEGGFYEPLRGYEDDELSLRLFINGYRGLYCPVPVVFWSNNLSSTSYSEDFKRSRLRYLERIDSLIPDNLFGLRRSIIGEFVAPRFFNEFVIDYLRALIERSPYVTERLFRLINVVDDFKLRPRLAKGLWPRILLCRIGIKLPQQIQRFLLMFLLFFSPKKISDVLRFY